jgi:hypothetical protein
VEQSSITVKEFIEAKFSEVHRRFDAQDEVSNEIRADVKKTNGRVNGHDVKIAVLMIAYGAAAFMAGAWYLGWVKPS